MISGRYPFCNITEYVSVAHNVDEVACTVPHIHSYYEIYYNVFGARGFMANSDFYKCDERDLIVIPRLCAHKVVVKKDCRYERCLINIDENIIDALRLASRSKSNLDWLVGNGNDLPRKVGLSIEQHREFMDMIEKYSLSASREDALGEFIKILSFLRRCFQTPQPAEYMDDEAIPYTDRIIKMIEKDFKNISVAQISEETHCSKDHLNRVFKSEVGTTIGSYLILRKLAEAQKFLYLGKSVKETCYLSGFNNYSNFLRTFKKYLGYSPGSFDNSGTV